MRLVELGWRGVCVEPSPKPLEGLRLTHVRNQKIQIVPAAVTADFNGTIEMYDCGGDAVSTTDEEHALKWAMSGVKYKVISVEAISIARLIHQWASCRFAFINLDVEGMSFEIFKRLPLGSRELRFLSCICVEHDNHPDEIVNIGDRHGYSLQHINAENVILSR